MAVRRRGENGQVAGALRQPVTVCDGPTQYFSYSSLSEWFSAQIGLPGRVSFVAARSRYAVAQTMLWSINGSLEILLGPLIGSLSDSIGRKWIIVFGRVGIGLIHLGYGFSTKLWHMVASECIGFGLLGAGNLATTNAAMDDMFGAMPERAATISARNLMYSSITGCIGTGSLIRRTPAYMSVDRFLFLHSFQLYRFVGAGPMLGALIATRAPFFSLSVLPAGLFALQVLLFATGPETLPENKRKPFSLRSANAFGSLRLLFTNGVGLRRLVLASGLFQGCTSNWCVAILLPKATECYERFMHLFNSAIKCGCNMIHCNGLVRRGIREPFRAGALGWTSTQSAYMDTVSIEHCSTLSTLGL